MQLLEIKVIKQKPVFGVSDKVMLRPACSDRETSKNVEVMYEASLVIVLGRKRITNALIRLRGCAGWSVLLLFACIKISLSRDWAHMKTVQLEQISYFVLVANLNLILGSIGKVCLYHHCTNVEG